jgi:hypothetical protein
MTECFPVLSSSSDTGKFDVVIQTPITFLTWMQWVVFYPMNRYISVHWHMYWHIRNSSSGFCYLSCYCGSHLPRSTLPGCCIFSRLFHHSIHVTRLLMHKDSSSQFHIIIPSLLPGHSRKMAAFSSSITFYPCHLAITITGWFVTFLLHCSYWPRWDN